MSNPENADFTTASGGPSDVAPLGRQTPKPEHEKTAAEDGDPVNWEAIAATEEFRGLLRSKAKFIIPATVFFIVYYLALPALVGFLPEMMSRPVAGANWAYLFALSQFFVSWALAWLYTRVAAKWDRSAAALVDQALRK
jgi:uncharacterized membrane protein (DUF485 family)